MDIAGKELAQITHDHERDEWVLWHVGTRVEETAKYGKEMDDEFTEGRAHSCMLTDINKGRKEETL